MVTFDQFNASLLNKNISLSMITDLIQYMPSDFKYMDYMDIWIILHEIVLWWMECTMCGIDLQMKCPFPCRAK